MNEQISPVLLTGTITPHSNAISKINDPSIRKAQYIQTLKWMAQARTQIDHVIFCDNSSTPLNDFEDLSLTYHKHKRSIEVYQVPMPDSKGFQGKGWGEGLILLWALRNVNTLRKHDGFYKITGRYRILNLERIAKVVRRGLSENPGLKFIGHALKVEKYLSIRSDFFWCNRDFYLDYLADSYKRVDDDQGYYLEHALAERLWMLKDKHDIALLPIPPLIHGVAGWNAKKFMGIRYYIREEIRQMLTPLPPLRYLTGEESKSLCPSSPPVRRHEAEKPY